MVAQAENPAKPQTPVAISVPETVKLPVFMDNHSTTAVDLRVVQAMLPFFTHHYGNAASATTRSAGRPRRQSTARADRSRRCSAAMPGDRLDVGRDRGQQPRDQGRGVVPAQAGQPHHHRRDRAQERARYLQAAAARGLRVTYLTPAKDGLVTPSR